MSLRNSRYLYLLLLFIVLLMSGCKLNMMQLKSQPATTDSRLYLRSQQQAPVLAKSSAHKDTVRVR